MEKKVEVEETPTEPEGTEITKAMIEATKCSLRNDILEIYDRCKDSKKITKWQLESIRFVVIRNDWFKCI